MPQPQTRGRRQSIGYAKMLGRGDAKQTQLAEQWLEETRAQLAGGTGADMEMIRTALAGRWAGRWADLLEEDPDAEAELRGFVQEYPDSTACREATCVGPRGFRQWRCEQLRSGSRASWPRGANSPTRPGRRETRTPHGISSPRYCLSPNARLGPEHPDTLAARASLAYWIGQAGDAVAARDRFAALLPVAERILGPEHPDTLVNRHNLANFTGYAGDAAAARDQFAALHRVRERVFGADSPDTLVARFNLAYWTGRAGAAAAARDQFAELLPSRER